MAVSAACNAEDFVSADVLVPRWEPALVAACSSCVSESGRAYTAQGWQSLLLGDAESARCLFELGLEHELKAGAASVMPRCGLLLCGDVSQRTALESEIDEAGLSPAELFYVGTLLRFLNHDVQGAAAEFAEHSLQYRADAFSRYWAVLLYHYAGDDARARELAQDWLGRHADDAVGHFLLALTAEFYGGSLSADDAALSAAERAAALLPSCAAVHLLRAHLLFGAGKEEPCLQSLERARACGAGVLYVSASLYEATLLQSMGRDEDSLALRRSLNAECALESAPQDDVAVLQRWEVMTLPLRVLVQREKAASPSEFRAAVNAATPKKSWPEDAAARAYVDVLSNVLLARMKNDGRFIERAEASEKEFERLSAQLKKSASPMCSTCLERARTACKLSILSAKFFVYRDSSSVWQEDMQEFLSLPQVRCLPPVLPKKL